jgi:hypothetical protein
MRWKERQNPHLQKPGDSVAGFFFAATPLCGKNSPASANGRNGTTKFGPVSFSPHRELTVAGNPRTMN